MIVTPANPLARCRSERSGRTARSGREALRYTVVSATNAPGNELLVDGEKKQSELVLYHFRITQSLGTQLAALRHDRRLPLACVRRLHALCFSSHVTEK